MSDEAYHRQCMFYHFQELKRLGWRDATYCPKDGTVFEAIEIGSTGVHDCHYEGEWPNGYFAIHDDGARDIYPSSNNSPHAPILFREKEDR